MGWEPPSQGARNRFEIGLSWHLPGFALPPRYEVDYYLGYDD